jgi:hypothetical protein
LTYAALAPALLLSQHAAVALAFRSAGHRLDADIGFWLLPLRRLVLLPDLSPLTAALVFAFSLAATWALVLASFRRASRSGDAHSYAIFSVIPVLQIAAVTMLALMPIQPTLPDAELETEGESGISVSHVLQGLLAGMAIIVVAVLVSALTFGAYGWGLFVMTPFLVGVTTAYLANRRAPLSSGRTMSLVISAVALGSVALIMLALEGLFCLLLAAPLGLAVAVVGGAIGREIAVSLHRKGTPLMSVAVLPLIFALEAASPPAAPIVVRETIEISAPRAAVWRALTSGEPIASPPGLVGSAGLAYPIRGRLTGEGVGAERIGEFSTGTARERVTEWAPGRRLAFAVLDQPPAMEEMSPYRRVHAPHVSGYFDTEWTSFDIETLPGGGTRLTARAAHVLRIDPVLYWAPIARWAVNENVSRVLRDIKDKAERRSQLPR